MVLPLLWLIGAVVAGGAVGVAMASPSEEELRKQEAREARHARKMDDLQKQLSKAAQAFRERNESDKFIISLMAIGVAMANADGEIHKQEKQEIEEYILGLSGKGLPKVVKDACKKLLDNPPNFNQAMIYVKELGKDSWGLVDNILEVVKHADGIEHEGEKEFIRKWNQYKESNNLLTKGSVQ